MRNCYVLLAAQLMVYAISPGVMSAQQKSAVDLRCSDTTQPVCKFLADNYDEMRARCGFLASTRAWPPSHWIHSYRPIDSVPQDIFYAIDDTSFKASASDDSWQTINRSSLIRLLSYVGPDVGSKLASPLAIDDPRVVTKTLRFDPTVSPDVSLVTGFTNLFTTMSCQDVSQAMLSAKVGIGANNANQKITGRSNRTSNYILAYGIFQSPMTYLKNSPSLRTNYYFDALDWYLRQMSPDVLTKDNLYFSAVRALVVYDESSYQSDASFNVNGSAGYSIPVFSIEGSASNQQATQSSISGHEFHVLLNTEASGFVTDKLPSWSETATYLSGGNIAANVASPLFDASAKQVKGVWEITGMPPSMCQAAMWMPVSTQNAPGTCKLDDKTSGTDFSIESVRASGGKCQFFLSRALIQNGSQLNGSIQGSLALKQPEPSDCSVAVPIKGGEATFNAPSLNSFPSSGLAQSADRTFTGSLWYQVQADEFVDKSVAPDVSAVKIDCGPNVTVSTDSVSATYQGKAQVSSSTISGSFFEIQFGGAGAPSKCSASGQVKLGIVGNSKAKTLTMLQPQMPPTTGAVVPGS